MASMDVDPRASAALTRPRSLTGPFFAWIGDLTEAWARRRAMQRTYRELADLNDRELNDIGLSRAQLRSVAWDSVLR